MYSNEFQIKPTDPINISNIITYWANVPCNAQFINYWKNDTLSDSFNEQITFTILLIIFIPPIYSIFKYIYLNIYLNILLKPIYHKGTTYH